MARVTDAEVEAIMEDVDSGTLFTPFILAANIIVTDRVGGDGLSTAILKEIERWFTAHLAAVKYRPADQEKVGDALIKYQGRTDIGLDSTMYGQRVKMLDPTGKMASIGKVQATVTAVNFDVE